MKRCVRAFSTASLLLLVLPVGCRTTPLPSPVPPAQRVRAAAATSAAAAKQAATCRDIALRAVDNAFAVQREAEADLADALHGEPADVIDANRAAVDEAWAETGAALNMAREVAVLAAATAAGAQAAVRDAAALKDDTASGSAAARQAQLAEDGAAAASRAAARAVVLTEELKRKWLLPWGSTNGSARVDRTPNPEPRTPNPEP